MNMAIQIPIEHHTVLDALRLAMAQHLQALADDLERSAEPLETLRRIQAAIKILEALHVF